MALQADLDGLSTVLAQIDGLESATPVAKARAVERVCRKLYTAHRDMPAAVHLYQLCALRELSRDTLPDPDTSMGFAQLLAVPLDARGEPLLATDPEYARRLAEHLAAWIRAWKQLDEFLAAPAQEASLTEPERQLVDRYGPRSSPLRIADEAERKLFEGAVAKLVSVSADRKLRRLAKVAQQVQLPGILPRISDAARVLKLPADQLRSRLRGIADRDAVEKLVGSL
ncbi:MAG: hypothetical protein R3F05_16100 [Planctomycetota bacterium]